ncbi:MAG TPA: histidinol-phosphatase [Thermoanaerobaculia bacterium]|jgi:histidinol-phosphatase
MNPDLQLALELADAADAITMKHFQSSTLAVRTKLDMTPVSEADEAVERVIRERLAADRPEDGILGEEFGTTGSGLRRWILDPIDGTKNYVRGIPVFATLIGLEQNSRIVAGVVSAPALGRRWWASAGEGAFSSAWNQTKQIRASSITTLEESHLTYDSLTDFDQHGGTVRFLSLLRRCTRARGFGDFWAHMLVAEGAVEIAIEPAVATWDMAAVQIIVEEAGGRFTDIRGNARFDGGSGISTNGHVHNAVLEFFR